MRAIDGASADFFAADEQHIRELLAAQPRPEMPADVADRGAMQRAADAYVTKYWDDPAVHDEMRTFFTSHALFEVSPTRAFGIVEREDEFARRATRWRW